MSGAAYIPSKLASGATEHLREHAFTRWMPRDLMQSAVNFCKQIGLAPIYCEFSPDGLTRYLFWQLPCDAFFEIRSGRTLDQFKAYDHANLHQGRLLISLHINEAGIHSAVWISPNHYQTAVSILAHHGITPARR